MVYPDQFIPILESTGRIVELDLYIFEQVAQFLQLNAQAGHRLLPIAVNASAVLARGCPHPGVQRDSEKAQHQRPDVGDRTDRDGGGLGVRTG